MKYACDIVILSYESPGLLKKCVESVFKNTTIPCRMIIVDNASRDPEVKEFLHQLEGTDKMAVQKVFSDENAGFAAGMNKGMKLADSPYVCLLNNDCEVTSGWLREMMLVAEISSSIGIVNPQSNTFGSVPVQGTTIHEHAELLHKHSEKYVETGHAIGFACLIKSEVIDSIGHLDEVYAGVCYEDSDFSLRARAAGFISVIAEGAYVFHVEQASRKNLPGKKRIYETNRKKFEQRWGKALRVLMVDPEAGRSCDVINYYGALKKLANQRIYLTVWTVSGRPASRAADAIKEGLLVRHTDVALKIFKRKIKNSAIILRVLTKKKKYDAVIVPGRSAAAVLRVLKPLHGAEILILENEFDLLCGKNRKMSLFGDSESIACSLREKRG